MGIIVGMQFRRPHARLAIATEGFDPVYGARPLKRVIQRPIENELAMRFLQGEFGEGSTVRVETTPIGGLSFAAAVTEAVPA